jgi:hypothetical protein
VRRPLAFQLRAQSSPRSANVERPGQHQQQRDGHDEVGNRRAKAVGQAHVGRGVARQQHGRHQRHGQPDVFDRIESGLGSCLQRACLTARPELAQFWIEQVFPGTHRSKA